MPPLKTSDLSADVHADCTAIHHDDATRSLPLSVRIANFLTIVLPFVGLAAAIFFLWGRGFSWLHLGLLLGGYAVTCLGVTIGFHRLFTHRAFQTSRPVKLFLGIIGSMAVQGPIVEWVATHRRHHQHSDDEGDPHSPHLHGHGLRGLVRGVLHAHFGWFFHDHGIDPNRYARDLLQDRMIRVVNALFPAWVVIGFLIPTALGGLLTMSWFGALMGFIWGGLVRVFLVHHVTWSINSVCHLWGTRPFGGHDESRNNPLFGIIGMGEGWHNNHHAFPTSARHGLRWWEIDVSYELIRAMAAVGLAWNLRIPTPQAIVAMRARPRRLERGATEHS